MRVLNLEQLVFYYSGVFFLETNAETPTAATAQQPPHSSSRSSSSSSSSGGGGHAAWVAMVVEASATALWDSDGGWQNQHRIRHHAAENEVTS